MHPLMLRWIHATALAIVLATAMMEFGNTAKEKMIFNHLFFCCSLQDLRHILNMCDSFCVLNDGPKNITYQISIAGIKYIVRFPKRKDWLEIDYSSEYYVNRACKERSLDPHFVFLNPETGIKVSRFIENVRHLDTDNQQDLFEAICLMQQVHNLPFNSGKFKRVDYLSLISKYVAEINGRWGDYSDIYPGIESLARQIFKSVIQDDIQYCICHLDCHAGNFLRDSSGNSYIIDFEYAGLFDARYDFAMFASNHCLQQESRTLFYEMCGFSSKSQLFTMDMFCIMAAFYNFLWGVYVKINGLPADNYIKQNIKTIFRIVNQYHYLLPYHR